MKSVNILEKTIKDFPLNLFAFQKWGIACSGGSDSLSLALSLKVIVKKYPHIDLTALIVDHGINPDLSAAALVTQQELNQQGIKSVILANAKASPDTAIEEWARKIRYDILTKHCHRHGIRLLFIAHHHQDQVETIALRKAGKSGKRGLSGMPTFDFRHNLVLVRPALKITKETLNDGLEDYRLSVVEDPSNKDEKFFRANMRINDQEFNLETTHNQNRLGLELEIAAFLAKRICKVSGANIIFELKKDDFNKDRELLLYGLGDLLASLGGGEFPPKKIKLEKALETIQTNKDIRLQIANVDIRSKLNNYGNILLTFKKIKFHSEYFWRSGRYFGS